MTTESPVINPDTLAPLYEPWEEPNAHRVRGKKKGDPAQVIKGRRASTIQVVQNLRSDVRQWRESFYAGASDTTRNLLMHWFERPHRKKTPAGDEFEFRYYFCQREAIETLIFLKEVRRIDCLSQIVGAFGGADAEIQALGITEEEDAWSRNAFKLATGAGKTKVMSLAIVWSYFHALRESDSEMSRHFVVIAPNLTVYERLKEDFGNGDIFDDDPLIPTEWRGDWNMSVVLQDEASGSATGGILYLTNIHHLYDKKKRKAKKNSETYSFMGPTVSKGSALDTGEALRDRITSHQRVMVLNDEAHHVWDPDNAWNEAIRFLHDTIKARTGGGLCAQLDFTATPKDNKGNLFKHVICDTPLGEAVDAGIVKTPIIGAGSDGLTEEPSDNAAYRYERHLRLGYERWKRSQAEWKKSEKKALLFVMCEDTEAADQITNRFNTDETFKELNGKTINLHTNLKGKVKKKGRGENAVYEFVESEKEISDEDLKALRKLSRELDENSSPYFCIVSVLMLREGWDVRNVTTIVPLRPYSSKANILPEQTLGRGLRRITPPGSQGANEIVTVVEHPAFASLYQQELAQEGLPVEVVDVDHVPSTTISIYPDEARKDLKALEIEIPTVAAGYRIIPKLEDLTAKDVKDAFSKGGFKPLPLGKAVKAEIDYEGRHLFTGEIIEQMKINLPLLETGVGAVSYYVQQLETICRLRGLHSALAPLIQTFLEEILFEKKTTIFDPELTSRLGDPDVAEHIRAIFVPLIRNKTTQTETRTVAGEPMRLSLWKAFQVTHSERRPALEAEKTLFNLVPCNRELEVALTRLTNRAPDVEAFAKNAGPQCLRIDYLADGGRVAFYTPDFFIRTKDKFYLVETKGREDRDVPQKARAAIAWCESASKAGIDWEYLYVPQGVFERFNASTIGELANTCRPALQTLIESDTYESKYPLFALIGEQDEEVSDVSTIVPNEILEDLPSRYKKAANQAISLFTFFKNKEGENLAPVFACLLGSIDEAAKGVIIRKLDPELPNSVPDQKAWFEVYFGYPEPKNKRHYENMAQNLKRTLVFKNGISPFGLLRNCYDYALNDNTKLTGVFEAVKKKFRVEGARAVLDMVNDINDFRNSYVAHHGEGEFTDQKQAEHQLKAWIEGLSRLTKIEGQS